jgi:branched-chain amino acid aminotransferase
MMAAAIRSSGMKIWLDGQLVDKSDAKLSVFDHGLLYGDGVFEGIRVYHGTIFECDAHMDRLFRSADRIRLKMPFTRQQIVDGLHQTLQANNRRDGYIRLVVTRGPGTLGLNPAKCPRGSVFIIADSIELYPRALYETGMPVIIAKTVRTAARMVDPSVKSLNYLNNIMARIECNDAGVAEAIMLNEHGKVAEGTGDNVFIVRGGKLMTPPAEAGVLLGVTRGVVLKLSRELGIPAAEQEFGPEELMGADECFLTGTAAEVISVCKINGKPVGSGTRGPVTLRLHEAFHQYIRNQCDRSGR